MSMWSVGVTPRRTRGSSWIFLLLFGLAEGSLSYAGQQEWQPLTRGDSVGACELIAGRIRENFSTLRTWRGTCRLNEASTLTGPNAVQAVRMANERARLEGRRDVVSAAPAYIK